MYEKLKKAQELLWKNEDCPDQEDYFEIQGIIAEVTLEAAQKERKTADLLETFPYLYERS